MNKKTVRVNQLWWPRGFFEFFSIKALDDRRARNALIYLIVLIWSDIYQQKNSNWITSVLLLMLLLLLLLLLTRQMMMMIMMMLYKFFWRKKTRTTNAQQDSCLVSAKRFKRYPMTSWYWNNKTSFWYWHTKTKRHQQDLVQADNRLFCFFRLVYSAWNTSQGILLSWLRTKLP